MIERNRLLIGIVGAVLGLSVVGVGVTDVNPCIDHTATEPQISFDISYESTTESLTVVHERGDRLTGDDTYSLVVRTRLATADEYVDQYELVSNPAEFPVERGDRWVIEPIRAQGQPLSENDTVRIYWIGHDIPTYCPNSKPRDRTIGKYIIGR